MNEFIAAINRAIENNDLVSMICQFGIFKAIEGLHLEDFEKRDDGSIWIYVNNGNIYNLTGEPVCETSNAFHFYKDNQKVSFLF